MTLDDDTDKTRPSPIRTNGPRPNLLRPAAVGAPERTTKGQPRTRASPDPFAQSSSLSLPRGRLSSSTSVLPRADADRSVRPANNRRPPDALRTPPPPPRPPSPRRRYYRRSSPSPPRLITS
uniref:Uncharacterized protein n=1 Tax=Plectus sambesii TaxID=2011161 RepID=A0A914X5X8_9BILA